MLVNVLNNLNQRKTRQQSDVSFITYEDKIKLLFLTLSWRRFLSYRNQFSELLCKSMDWFLYDGDLCHEKVKIITL